MSFKRHYHRGDPSLFSGATAVQSRLKSHTFTLNLPVFAPQPRWRQKQRKGLYLNNTNIHITCFTTSHARLALCDKLDYLQEKVLYFDTDSFICIDDGSKNTKTGDILGEISDDLSDETHSIYSFQQGEILQF